MPWVWVTVGRSGLLGHWRLKLRSCRPASLRTSSRRRQVCYAVHKSQQDSVPKPKVARHELQQVLGDPPTMIMVSRLAAELPDQQIGIYFLRCAL
jgi:hypothetical protein